MNTFPKALMASFLCASGAVCAVTAAAAAGSSAPQVTATQPVNDATDVSADLKDIVVSFDQDMDRGGASFTGGGSEFPKLRGKPFWRNARECVLPVELEPGHPYVVGINSVRHTNFRSAGGVPVQPLVLRFTTRAATSGVLPAVASPGTHADAVQRLREAVEHHYSHRETHTADWASLWLRFEPRLKAAASAREFAVVAGELLAATHDSHIWLEVGGETVPAFRRNVPRNIAPELLPRLVAKWTQQNRTVATGWAAPRVAYIAIQSWNRNSGRGPYEAAFKALEEFRSAPALIVDVRLNGGGSDSIAGEFAGCFVERRVLYARTVTLDATSPTGFSAPRERWLEPSAGRPHYGGKVAVLIGPANMSSAESFILMMKQSPAVTLIGQRTYGSSGNPKPHALGNGVSVCLPSWKEFAPNGDAIETKGIAPDMEVPFSREARPNRDAVLEKAVQMLNTNVTR
ncbi:MAG: S41 family peptidase [Verrucomicrobiia bacterium]